MGRAGPARPGGRQAQAAESGPGPGMAPKCLSAGPLERLNPGVRPVGRGQVGGGVDGTLETLSGARSLRADPGTPKLQGQGTRTPPWTWASTNFPDCFPRPLSNRSLVPSGLTGHARTARTHAPRGDAQRPPFPGPPEGGGGDRRCSSPVRDYLAGALCSLWGLPVPALRASLGPGRDAQHWQCQPSRDTAGPPQPIAESREPPAPQISPLVDFLLLGGQRQQPGPEAGLSWSGTTDAPSLWEETGDLGGALSLGPRECHTSASCGQDLQSNGFCGPEPAPKGQDPQSPVTSTAGPSAPPCPGCIAWSPSPAEGRPRAGDRGFRCYLGILSGAATLSFDLGKG